ncbi:MAG: SigE family RNA polymerase sigma factor [Acidimicrobiales bacterium]
MAAGGTDDFDSFVVGIQSRLQRSAWLLTGNWDDAEDLVQISLAKVWRHWDRVAGADSPEAYTRRTMLNSFLTSRRRRWHGEQPYSTLDPAPVGDAADYVAVRTSVMEALAHLSPRQRAAVVLRFFDDLGEAQVAEAMGCRPGTVKSTTSKALSRLRLEPGLQGLVEQERQR